MKQLTAKHRGASITRLKWLIVITLVLGLVVRFVNLDGKVYWHDEAYTSLKISAYTGAELVADLFTGQEVLPQDLMHYQRLDPDRTMMQTIWAMGMEDPQHPPLYYILNRWWVQVWGESITATRSLAAVLSLLVFPAAFWLCWELFASSLVGWMAIALFAVSPFQIVYAQEAREYSFWSATTLLCSAALVKALGRSNWRNWGLYTVTLTLSFYTALFSGLVAIAHGIYILLINDQYSLSITGFRLGKQAIAYLTASLIAVIAFIPWICFLVIAATSLNVSTSWASISLPPSVTLKLWIANFSRGLIDFNFNLDQPLPYLLMVPAIVIQLYAIYFLCKNASKHVWLFILTLIAIPFLALLLPDLIGGGQRSIVTRYLVPSYVGLPLAMAYLLANQIRSMSINRRRLGEFLTLIILVSSIVSCGVYAQADTWWNKTMSTNYREVARIINESDRPLIISDGFGANPSNIIALSYLLESQTKLLLLPAVGNSFNMPPISPSFTDIFLFDLPEVFRKQFETRYKTKLTKCFEDPWNELWTSTLKN